MIKLNSIVPLALILAGPPAFADSRPVVLELFTSQGCDSCPPADALLGELAERPDVIALAYHVDYWDHQGWKDVFDLPEATARQHAYAHALSLANVYTPQMVIDGKTDIVGFDRPSILAALGNKPDGVPLHLSYADGKITVAIGAATLKGPAEITLLAVSHDAETKVKRGENAGRSLKEYAIVRAIRPLGKWNGEAKTITLDRSTLPDGAEMAALLIQGVAHGPVIGAATTALPASTTSSSGSGSN